MVPGACQDRLEPRYLVWHSHRAPQYVIFHNSSFKSVFLNSTQKVCNVLSLLLRETEGLMAWLDFPVKRDTEWVILWKACMCIWLFLCGPLLYIWMFVAVGWAWTLWTSWCYWRGWREGKIEKKHIWFHIHHYWFTLHFLSFPETSFVKHSCYATESLSAPEISLSSRRSLPPRSHSTFPLIFFDPCTPLSASNLPVLSSLHTADATWPPLPHTFSLCLPIISAFSQGKHPYTHTQTHTHTCLHQALTRPLSFLGRWWRYRTQGSSWWTSEWSHVLIFSFSLSDLSIDTIMSLC